jgi:hypothetical protein
MATSGTTSFGLDLVEIAEEAFERCGAELRSGYDLRTARRSLNLLFAEWSNRGLNLWTMEQGTIALVAGVATYALPADTVDTLDHFVRTSSSDLGCSRIGMTQYLSIPNKNTQGRPVQVFVERLQAPRITVWPVPDSGQYTLVYGRLRRIQDAGGGANTMDVPVRFLPALIAGLAYYLSMKIPEAAARAIPLKAAYDEAWQLAADEDRDRSPTRFVPGGY